MCPPHGPARRRAARKGSVGGQNASAMSMDWRGKGRAHARQILLALGVRAGGRLEEPPRIWGLARVTLHGDDEGLRSIDGQIGCQKTTRSTLTCTNCAMLRSLPGRFGNSTTSRSSARPRSSWVKTPAEQHAPVPPQRSVGAGTCATCSARGSTAREVRDSSLHFKS